MARVIMASRESDEKDNIEEQANIEVVNPSSGNEEGCEPSVPAVKTRPTMPSRLKVLASSKHATEKMVANVKPMRKVTGFSFTPKAVRMDDVPQTVTGLQIEKLGKTLKCGGYNRPGNANHMLPVNMKYERGRA